MVVSQRSSKQSQTEIFSAYGWREKSNLLNRLTIDRCNYIESRLERVLGKGSFGQQEVLEVGCGGGLICEELARRGLVVTGIDPSEAALEEARRYVQKNYLGANAYFEIGIAEALPYADGSFSVIICLDTLEHVRNLKACIQEIARVLAPGGVFIFDTINRTFLARLALIWIGEHFFQNNGLVPGLHDYSAFIKPRELQALVSENNLQVQELVGFMPRIIEGRLTLGSGWFKGVSYVGYATKERENR
ncbi:MAG: 3-demethylubiquinone-9 3-O-methyltransferase [Ktedonobacteraceae bacterium]|nr:3-demethylubiquinone-9 3-O-methyltransferase [Ktedonobacteraceae bacterium]